MIYPPVDIHKFTLQNLKQDYYFTASRMVPYKKIKLIVSAFNRLPHKKLVVSGDGPEFNAIKEIAKSNITLLGFTDGETLKAHLQNAKAFVFAAEEDFGIVPVEAQACGTPVIGYGKGGLLETVIDSQTGVYFKEQTEDSIINAIEKFDKIKFDAVLIRQSVLKFSKERFIEEITNFVEDKYKAFKLN